MTTGDSKAKRLYETLEGFSSSDNLENQAEDSHWPLYDYKSDRKFVLPTGSAVNFLKEYCENISTNGVVNQNGEPYYYFGEPISNTRPLRIDFSATLKTDDLDDYHNIYKLLISSIVIVMNDMFVKTSHGKEHRICTIMYSTETPPSRVEFSVYFPYCRLKNSDFKEGFYHELCNFMDDKLGHNLYSLFQDVEEAKDMIEASTLKDIIPLVGSVEEQEDYPKDKFEVWYINDIPKDISQVHDADISPMDEDDEDTYDLLAVETHFVFETGYLAKPRTVAEKKFWIPLVFTNSFWKQRLSMKKPETNQSVSSSSYRNSGASFGTRQSPFMRRMATRAETNQHSQINIIDDIRRHIDETGDYQTVPVAKKKALVRFIEERKHLDEIQKIVKQFVEMQGWFEMDSLNPSPPIGIGSKGFYLKFESLKMVLDHLDKSRCNITSMLHDIACIIYTIAHTYEEREDARHIFIEFVRENPAAFKERGEEDGLSELFKNQIKRASKGRLTFWTLMGMFKEDDPLYYSIWWLYICDYYALRSLDSEMASFSVAKAASLPLIGKFIHTTGDNRPTWWEYSGTYWKNIHDSQYIELKLTTQFISTINSVEQRYSEIAHKLQTKKISFAALKDKLQEANFRSGIIRDISNVLLRDNRLLNFSDGNDPEYADFFASYNYVYQYSDGEMKRRPGRWEDFLTKTFDVIDEKLPITDTRCQFILKWVHKMIRDPATEHEFLKEIATYIRGFNRNKRFSVWYGFGNGGKSKFMDLLSSTLGLKDGHSVKIPLDSMLEGGKKSAGAASPEVDQARNAFLAIYDEPKKGQKFDAGKIKATTGNDPMYSRTLFSKGGTFRPMFKSVLLGNVVPKADFDDAMKVRFWVWNFKGKFVEKSVAPPTEEEQERTGIYPLDEDLDTKLPEYRPAMFAVLLHYFKLYCKEGVKKTKDVVRATEAFWNSANDVLCFLSEFVTETGSVDDMISTDEMYDYFKRWFMNRNNGDRVPTKLTFSDELSAIYTTQRIKEQGGVIGYRFRDNIM